MKATTASVPRLAPLSSEKISDATSCAQTWAWGIQGHASRLGHFLGVQGRSLPVAHAQRAPFPLWNVYYRPWPVVHMGERVPVAFRVVGHDLATVGCVGLVTAGRTHSPVDRRRPRALGAPPSPLWNGCHQPRPMAQGQRFAWGVWGHASQLGRFFGEKGWLPASAHVFWGSTGSRFF